MVDKGRKRMKKRFSSVELIHMNVGMHSRLGRALDPLWWPSCWWSSVKTPQYPERVERFPPEKNKSQSQPWDRQNLVTKLKDNWMNNNICYLKPCHEIPVKRKPTTNRSQSFTWAVNKWLWKSHTDLFHFILFSKNHWLLGQYTKPSAISEGFVGVVCACRSILLFLSFPCLYSHCSVYLPPSGQGTAKGTSCYQSVHVCAGTCPKPSYRFFNYTTSACTDNCYHIVCLAHKSQQN